MHNPNFDAKPFVLVLGTSVHVEIPCICGNPECQYTGDIYASELTKTDYSRS